MFKLIINQLFVAVCIFISGVGVVGAGNYVLNNVAFFYSKKI